MKIKHVLAALAATLSIGAANASVVDIVNISTKLGVNPVQAVDPLNSHVQDVGVTLHLDAGDWLVTPIDTDTGGAYTAANRFNQVDITDAGSYNGWEWNYYLLIGSAPGTAAGVMHGFGGGIPATGGAYQLTPLAAFDLAPAPVEFSLASATDVTFYWLDDIFGDNVGGISLKVSAISAVPEPGTWALMLAGLVGVVGVARRRRA